MEKIFIEEYTSGKEVIEEHKVEGEDSESVWIIERGKIRATTISFSVK
ncbi:hypothetical protein [Virgibacillus halodenitrificans]|nr:hypothetical protein [Virgibacillus halodenitrificans]